MGQAAADLPARWAGNTLGKGQGGSGESKLFPAIVALPSPLTSPGGGRLVSPKLLTASPPTYPHLQGCLQARPQRWQRWPSAWSLGLHPLINALTLSYQGRKNLLQPSFPDTVSLSWCHFRSGLCGGQRASSFSVTLWWHHQGWACGKSCVCLHLEHFQSVTLVPTCGSPSGATEGFWSAMGMKPRHKAGYPRGCSRTPLDWAELHYKPRHPDLQTTKKRKSLFVSFI